jgi:hypothetical protein
MSTAVRREETISLAERMTQEHDLPFIARENTPDLVFTLNDIERRRKVPMYTVTLIQPVEGQRLSPLNDKQPLLKPDSANDPATDGEWHHELAVRFQIQEHETLALGTGVDQKPILKSPQSLFELGIDNARLVTAV